MNNKNINKWKTNRLKELSDIDLFSLVNYVIRIENEGKEKLTDNQKNEQWFITKTMEREKLIVIIIEYELSKLDYTKLDYTKLDYTKNQRSKKPTEIKYGVPKQLK